MAEVHTNGGELDTESLQAQIDLSMSLAHDMISSWIKPSNKPANNMKKTNVDEELKEYLRRPPRLGVGATVPETYNSMTRETAQLKTRLTQGLGKRTREETEAATAASVPQIQEVDAEEDSRAGSIKKKPRIDPFSEKKKKKKKHKSQIQSTPEEQNANVQPPATSREPDMASTSSTSLPNDIPHNELVEPLHPESSVKSGAETKRANFSSSSINPSAPAGPAIAKPAIPVLNLGEPNQESDIHDNIQDANAGNAKKRRKKRRKKNKALREAKSNDVPASN